MNLKEELDRLEKSDLIDEDTPYDPLFGHKIKIWRDMAKRIEALEQREHSHPLGVGSLAKRREGE